MNNRINTYRIIMHIVISVSIVAPIAVIIISYYRKARIFNGIPSSLVSGIIVIFFIFLAVILRIMIDKFFKKQRYAFEELMDNLIKEISHTWNVEEIIKRVVDLLYKSLSIKYSFAILLNNEKRIFELFYSNGRELDIKPIDINSGLIKWFAHNNDVLNIDSAHNDENTYREIREDINNIFGGLDVKVILPVYNDKQIIGILGLGEKSSTASYKSGDINKLQQFNNESNLRITNAIDYEEWNRGQFVSGILDLSSEILSKAVPVNLPKLPDIAFGAFYIPRYREGIDYFDFITPTNTGVGVIVTDISERGINNAIYSVVLRSAFHSCIEDAHSTFTTMQRLNKALHMYAKEEKGIVKAYYFYYNIYTKGLIYTNAGFQPLEIYRVDKNLFESLDTEGFPLGTDLTANYSMARTNLLLGDIGFLYSRALIESINQNGEKFGLTQLRRIIKENRGKHPSEITGILQEEFLSFMGPSSPESNILVIIFKV